MSSGAVVIPAYGRHELTEGVIRQLEGQQVPHTIYVVDNGGDYQAPTGVTRLDPGVNLGWAEGCNYGLRHASGSGHSWYVLLNNDVQISSSFLGGLVSAWATCDAHLLGPVYDHNWPQQRIEYDGPASQYSARETERVVPFIDGTCMFIPRETFMSVGFLDSQSWPKFGWGCDKDYALRVRETGWSVWVTERAYLNHDARGTARYIAGYSEAAAEDENDVGMRFKWGA